MLSFRQNPYNQLTMAIPLRLQLEGRSTFIVCFFKNTGFLNNNSNSTVVGLGTKWKQGWAHKHYKTPQYRSPQSDKSRPGRSLALQSPILSLLRTLLQQDPSFWARSITAGRPFKVLQWFEIADEFSPQLSKQNFRAKISDSCHIRMRQSIYRFDGSLIFLSFWTSAALSADFNWIVLPPMG